MVGQSSGKLKTSVSCRDVNYWLDFMIQFRIGRHLVPTNTGVSNEIPFMNLQLDGNAAINHDLH